MTWDEIFQTKSWAPLKEVFPEAQHIEGGLYRIDSDKYAFTSDYDLNSEKGKPGAPFVTLVYWGASEEAVKRCILYDIAVSVPLVEVSIPPELSLGTDGTYGALLQTKEIQAVPIRERAAYHGPTGLFLHNILDATKFIYYFPSRRIKKKEKPYAIEVRLWAK